MGDYIPYPGPFYIGRGLDPHLLHRTAEAIVIGDALDNVAVGRDTVAVLHLALVTARIYIVLVAEGGRLVRATVVVSGNTRTGIGVVLYIARGPYTAVDTVVGVAKAIPIAVPVKVLRGDVGYQFRTVVVIVVVAHVPRGLVASQLCRPAVPIAIAIGVGVPGGKCMYRTVVVVTVPNRFYRGTVPRSRAGALLSGGCRIPVTVLVEVPDGLRGHRYLYLIAVIRLSAGGRPALVPARTGNWAGSVRNRGGTGDIAEATGGTAGGHLPLVNVSPGTARCRGGTGQRYALARTHRNVSCYSSTVKVAVDPYLYAIGIVRLPAGDHPLAVVHGRGQVPWGIGAPRGPGDIAPIRAIGRFLPLVTVAPVAPGRGAARKGARVPVVAQRALAVQHPSFQHRIDRGLDRFP
ncbi:hypothetical protein HX109_10810 [Galbibacter sp. BG1]|nr:hypothetical protein HX109_10810 [Galbibacter sp. BG1]